MRRPQPPFAKASAIEKVGFAEDAWNSRDAAAGERHDAERDVRGSASSWPRDPTGTSSATSVDGPSTVVVTS